MPSKYTVRKNYKMHQNIAYNICHLLAHGEPIDAQLLSQTFSTNKKTICFIDILNNT